MVTSYQGPRYRTLSLRRWLSSETRILESLCKMIVVFAVTTVLNSSLHAQVAPTANDDEAETTVGVVVDIDLVANDSAGDNPIDDATVEIVQNGAFVADFNGSNDSIAWANLGLNGASAISKFIRFRTSDTRAVLCDIEFSGLIDNGLYIGGGFLKARIAFNTAGLQTINITAAADAADDDWHTAGFTYDGTTFQTYFDGVAQGSLAIAGDTLRHNYISTCGKRVISNSFFFAGQLSNFVVYSTAVSSTDASNFHNGVTRFSDLVLFGRMNESSFGGGLADSSGNGNDGTANGATPIQDLDTPEAPLSGGVVNNGNGSVTYTPAAGFSGSDSFEYTVNDTSGLTSNVATVTINVNAFTEIGICYATTGFGSGSGGDLLTIDLNSGASSVIGNTGLSAVAGLAVNSAGALFGFDTNSVNGDMYRIDAINGAARFAFSTGLLNVDALAFDSSDVLWGVEGSSGDLVRIDTTTGVPTVIGNVGVQISGLAFDPTNGILYGSAGGGPIGDANNELSIYTINTSNGTATRVGLSNNLVLRTQIGRSIPDIHFDVQGNLYAIIGGARSINTNSLILINKTTFEGRVIGHSGLKSVSGLTSRPDLDGTIAVDDEDTTSVNTSVDTDVINNDIPGSGSISGATVEIQNSTGSFATSFDGTNDSIAWADLGLNGTSAISKFVRFKTSDTSAILFDIEFGSGADGGLYISGGNLNARVVFQTEGTQTVAIVADSVAADNTWHTAGFTYDGATLQTYFDGAAQGSRGIPGDTVTHNYISVCGKRLLSNGGFYAGSLRDFVVYDTALSATQVSVYDGGQVPFCNLVFWGRMNEGTYTAGLADSSGNGSDGTASGVTPSFDSSLSPGPANGTITDNGNGTVQYTPVDSCFVGTDSYEYTVEDTNGNLSTNTATVTITVE